MTTVTNVNEFVAALNAAFEASDKPNNQSFAVEAGRKYDRVVGISHGQRSAFCFTDSEGNIYKSASWKTPAKGVRATFATLPADFAERIAASGYADTSWLYRR